LLKLRIRSNQLLLDLQGEGVSIRCNPEVVFSEVGNLDDAEMAYIAKPFVTHAGSQWIHANAPVEALRITRKGSWAFPPDDPNSRLLTALDLAPKHINSTLGAGTAKTLFERISLVTLNAICWYEELGSRYGAMMFHNRQLLFAVTPSEIFIDFDVLAVLYDGRTMRIEQLCAILTTSDQISPVVSIGCKCSGNYAISCI
jgi:hypothetical protein